MLQGLCRKRGIWDQNLDHKDLLKDIALFKWIKNTLWGKKHPLKRRDVVFLP